MISAIGDITFLTDGKYYSCVWHPQGQDHTGPEAKVIADIAVKLIADANDLSLWKDEVLDRFKNIVGDLLGSEVNFESLPIKDTRN